MAFFTAGEIIPYNNAKFIVGELLPTEREALAAHMSTFVIAQRVVRDEKGIITGPAKMVPPVKAVDVRGMTADEHLERVKELHSIAKGKDKRINVPFAVGTLGESEGNIIVEQFGSVTHTIIPDGSLDYGIWEAVLDERIAE